MSTWPLPTELTLRRSAPASSPCFEYAAAELVRLLGRLGITLSDSEPAGSEVYALVLGDGQAGTAGDIAHDGFVLTVAEGGAAVAAPTAKGVLNGVYDLAERLGFRFLMPGEEGERKPEADSPALPVGEWRCEPRFAHRGVFGGLTTPPFNTEQWLTFFAKLRFNAQSHKPEDAALAAKLGIRLEIGGHGMSDLLPRALFAEHPEYFRMFQPEDFGGKRQTDANFCVTHPESVRLIRENFRQQIAALENVYAVHAWADDLPGGGWCMCSRCRAFSAGDQSLLAMRLQAEAVATEKPGMRVPCIAYHDTLFPGTQVLPPPECFLLYAPRERCYAHALDDENCAKNRWHREALDAWMARFAGIDDAHTFEYYFDQILYRGLYPFIPEVIIGDMGVYEAAGIESHTSLQVGGGLTAPDHNMLVFARAHWDADLTADQAVRDLARQLDPLHPEPWLRLLDARRRAYSAALAICDVPNDIYFDYRFMPELTQPCGGEIARRQAAAATRLRDGADELEDASRRLTPAAAKLAGREIARCRFEAADLQAMSMHQAGLNALARYHVSHTTNDLKMAVASLQAADGQLARAAEVARENGVPDGAYYHNFNARWTRPEVQAKIAIYSAARD